MTTPTPALGAAPLDPWNRGQSHPYRGGQGPLSGANSNRNVQRDVWRDDQHDQRPNRGQRHDGSRS